MVSWLNQAGGLGNHYENYINAIRANDQSLAKAGIEEGFYSCALIHLGNIAYRLGRTLVFDPVTMRFKNDPEADALLTTELPGSVCRSGKYLTGHGPARYRHQGSIQLLIYFCGMTVRRIKYHVHSFLPMENQSHG